MNDIYWMRYALQLAKQAEKQGEVPVGAVLLLDGKIIAEGWNCPITTHDPTAHAEIIALRKAAQQSKNYRLPETTLYVTLEPCAMCAGAITQARIKRVVFGAKAEQLNYPTEYYGSVLAEECATLLQEFFRSRR